MNVPNAPPDIMTEEATVRHLIVIATAIAIAMAEGADAIDVFYSGNFQGAR